MLVGKVDFIENIFKRFPYEFSFYVDKGKVSRGHPVDRDSFYACSTVSYKGYEIQISLGIATDFCASRNQFRVSVPSFRYRNTNNPLVLCCTDFKKVTWVDGLSNVYYFLWVDRLWMVHSDVMEMSWDELDRLRGFLGLKDGGGNLEDACC